MSLKSLSPLYGRYAASTKALPFYGSELILS
ncbi:hypothetical protein B1R32_1057 [Abditibacterium utsteinense]|uniref:Uncharacterized protein n=1 Tax=Abditibacterium utsteinense TaxID=1960156 RepID=A0A2S8SU55_9BACT|nr:hypothetical protein B1R32_1057 [Abditibacterium utsteinense]